MDSQIIVTGISFCSSETNISMYFCFKLTSDMPIFFYVFSFPPTLFSVDVEKVCINIYIKQTSHC